MPASHCPKMVARWLHETSIYFMFNFVFTSPEFSRIWVKCKKELVGSQYGDIDFLTLFFRRSLHEASTELVRRVRSLHGACATIPMTLRRTRRQQGDNTQLQLRGYFDKFFGIPKNIFSPRNAYTEPQKLPGDARRCRELTRR